MLDAIIISDTGEDTYSASSPYRLQIDGKIALIQNIKNYIENKGKLSQSIKEEKTKNWHYSYKLNGIKLYDCLQKAGYIVELIDSYYQERDYFKKIALKNPKAIIISTTFILTKQKLQELVMDIRSIAPDIPIIAGGPFVFSSYLLLKRASDIRYDIESPKNDYLFLNHANRPDIDLYVVDKFGEQVLPEVLRLIEKKQPLHTLPNTAHWDGNKYVFSSRKEMKLSDTTIAWENMPDKIFNSKAINVQASIGCPFNCEFCNFVKDKNHTFLRPLNELITELKIISKKGGKFIRFVDDNFRLGKNDLNDVCKRFIDEGIDMKWMSFIRASTLDQTDPILLKKSGCIETQIGIESADPSILKNMNKSADPGMYFRVISKLLDVGINCSCCFIIGFPGETQDSFQNTIDFIESIPKDTHKGIFSWSIYPFILAPLSPIYEIEKRAKYGLHGYMNKWRHSTMSSDQAYLKIKEAFLTIEKASPIYSGDNLDMLMELSIENRKKFMIKRHDLSKKFLKETFDKEIVIKSFSEFFDHQYQ